MKKHLTILTLISALLLALLLAGCGVTEESPTEGEPVTLSYTQLAAANDIAALCRQHGAVSYLMDDETEDHQSTLTYWLEGEDLVFTITSNYEGDSTFYYTPQADFSAWADTTYVSLHLTQSDGTTTLTSPFPNGFLEDLDAAVDLDNCLTTKEGYTFSLRYHYDETSYMDTVYETDQNLVITHCTSTVVGTGFTGTSTVTLSFPAEPPQAPDFVTRDPVTLTLITRSDQEEETATLSLPRNCVLSVFTPDGDQVVARDPYGTELVQEEITVTDDLTLYAIDLATTPVG